MNRILSAFLLAGMSLPVFSQTQVFKFWVELSDKNNTRYSVDHPEAFLSERAIERRKKQGIAITERDFPVNESYLSEIEAKGVKLVHTSKWFNAVTVRCTDSSVMAEIRKLSFVKGTRLLYDKVESETKPKGNEAMMEYLMSMSSPKKPENNSDYGFGLGQIAMLEGDDLHQRGHKGKGIVIAVLDAGFYKMHDMEVFDHLRNEGKLLGTWDVVMQDTLVYEDDMHGMNVLSCMASYMPGKMIGTAPDASYWLIRTEDNFSEYPIEESNWIRGAEMADSIGADVINSSLGYTQFDNTKLSHTYSHLNGKSLASQAATYCAHVGIIVCNAAGNEGNGKWHYIGVPADADSILTVGGVDEFKDHSTFSSFGPTYDGRIKPTVCAQATATYVASSKGKFYASQGTSFASPVLCGMVASLWSAHPDKTNIQVMNAIIQSSDRYSHPDNTFGYGIPDFMMAHRILGGDPDFDYSKDQWLQEIPTTYYDQIPLHFYSSKAQTLKIVVKDHKGRKVRNMEFALEQGQFFLHSLKDLPKSKKGISLEIQVGEEVKTYSLNQIKD
ncbi:MAG: S8 family serine peptidase [Bacteroidota bacterium]|nr:S8 family serine peptidase [Bacteroidota bacterium]MDX5430572.1 S8 family serine peptidase [Bacteroidota bacterium]MDX5469324.1 S8 family serine peptidase [Bacteroidota bacterium]